MPSPRGNGVTSFKPKPSTDGPKESFLSIFKYMKEARESLGPRPSTADVEAASSAVSSILSDLENQIHDLAASQPPDGVPSQGEIGLSLRAFKEDVARAKAQMRLLPHASILDLDRKFRRYDAAVAAAEDALLSGKWDPDKLGHALHPCAADSLASLPSPLLTLNVPSVFSPRHADFSTTTALTALPSDNSVPLVQSASAAPTLSLPRSATLEDRSIRPAVSVVAGSKDDHHHTAASALGVSRFALASAAAPRRVASTTQPLLAKGTKGSNVAAETVEEGAPVINIDPVLLKIIQDSVISKPRTLDIRGHLFSSPLEYIPETLGFIDSLTELHVAENQLVVLPDSIGSLKHLSILDASCNQLLELPRTIGDLKELSELDLHHNKIEELPVTIGECEALEVLHLEFNNLKALPKALGSLKKLKTLTLHLNQISMLPYTMGQLESLTALDVHHNQLQGIPESIGRLGKLEKLNISANHFDLQSLPSSLGQLSSLKELDIRENHIRVLPLSVSQLTGLTSLKMEGNPWKEPPMEVAHQGMKAVMEWLSNPREHLKEDRASSAHSSGLFHLFRRGHKNDRAKNLEEWKKGAQTWGA